MRLVLYLIINIEISWMQTKQNKIKLKCGHLQHVALFVPSISSKGREKLLYLIWYMINYLIYIYIYVKIMNFLKLCPLTINSKLIS